MLGARDMLSLSLDALRAHRLRTALTVLGITMGVGTLITVVTLIQGANLYVETKIANLGSDVFQIGRLPFAVTDFELLMRSLRNRRFTLEDYHALADGCPDCRLTGASGTAATRARRVDEEIQDVSLTGHTASMADIDTRVIEAGRMFTRVEDQHRLRVCLIGATLRERFFPAEDPVGRTIRLANEEFTVIGVYEKAGSVLGQDSDNFAVIPLGTFLWLRGARTSLVINVRVPGDPAGFERAMDQARLLMRARRHRGYHQDDDFFIGTKDSYIDLWNQISGAFFLVFILVSSISAVVGGIVIMNVMLVSVTERTREIGLRRAVGAGAGDVLRQFLTESVLQCVAGGVTGVLLGFACAEMLRRFTDFPASVEAPVALLGVGLASAIGLFFGIYPAAHAASLDPVEALRSE
jgi:putative ABC transport system permease protein